MRIKKLMDNKVFELLDKIDSRIRKYEAFELINLETKQ